MKKQIFAALAVMIVLIAVLAGVKFMQISAAIAAGESRQPPPNAVTSATATVQVWPITSNAVGTLTAVEGAMLSTEEMGRVTEVNFDSGSTVEAGQVLVAMDTAVEEAQLKAAEARLKLAEINLPRQKVLREKNANSQSDLDTAIAQKAEAEAEVARLRAVIKRKKIIAPFSGHAGIRMVNIGQTVEAGTPVVALQRFSPLYVDFSFPQRELGRVKVGGEVQVRVDSHSGRVFSGEITAIDSAVDSSTRLFAVRATIPNEDLLLRPGMFVEVEVISSEERRLITIPASSINYAPYGNTVYVIEPPQAGAEGAPRAIRPQVITLGPKRGDQIAILEGLKEGEEVVSSGVFQLRPDSKVIINNTVTPGNNPSPTPKDT